MTDSYEDVMQQIEALKKKAEEIKKSQSASAIVEAKAIIEKHQLTAEDLGFETRKGKGKVKVPAAGKVVKYRSDTNPGDTYGGKGPLPGWLKAKIAQGREKAEFEVR